MNDESARTIARLSDLDLMPHRVYRLRMLGMGLAAPAIAAALYENAAAWPSWAMMVFTCVLWPQLALFIARRSSSPYRAELRNLMLDSAQSGLWVSLMYFNLLPGVLLVTLATVDKISTGIRGLWLWSLPGLLGGLLVGAALTGFTFRPETSMLVTAACVPLLVIHTIAVSLTSYRLVRKVQRQNRQLDELNRRDPLTGLASRDYWLTHASRLLADCHAGRTPASLVLIDIDRFKAVNDSHGHAAGDQALRSVAEVMRAHSGPDDLAGRIGGDELGLVLAAGREHTLDVADNIRRHIARTSSESGSITVSIGLAEAGATDRDLHAWMEAADRALYRAKQSGRNRVEARDEQPPAPGFGEQEGTG